MIFIFYLKIFIDGSYNLMRFKVKIMRIEYCIKEILFYLIIYLEF